MKTFWRFLIIFLVSLLQSTVFSLNLLLIFILVEQSYWWAFLAGLSLDLLSGQRLGLSSLLFLIILFLFRLYSRKYEPRNFFLAPFVFLMSFLFAKIEVGNWNFREGIILVLCSFILRKRFKKKLQLKLDL